MPRGRICRRPPAGSDWCRSRRRCAARCWTGRSRTASASAISSASARRADIGFGLVLDWLSRDPGTGAILLDIRQLRDRRAFLSAARAASRLRPVVAIRPGGVLADPSGAAERAFEAALRRAGVLCVTSLEDLLAAAEILARARPVRSEALSIVTNAIGAGRMAADAVLRDGLRLACDIVHVRAGRFRASGRRWRKRAAGGCPASAACWWCMRRPARTIARRSPRSRQLPRATTAAAAGLRHGRDHGRRLPAQPGRGRHGGVRHARAGGARLPASGAGPPQPRRRARTAAAARCWRWRRTATRCAACFAAIRRAGRLRHDAGRGAGGAVRLRHPGGADPRRRLGRRCRRGGGAARASRRW